MAAPKFEVFKDEKGYYGLNGFKKLPKEQRRVDLSEDDIKSYLDKGLIKNPEIFKTDPKFLTEKVKAVEAPAQEEPEQANMAQEEPEQVNMAQDEPAKEFNFNPGMAVINPGKVNMDSPAPDPEIETIKNVGNVAFSKPPMKYRLGGSGSKMADLSGARQRAAIEKFQTDQLEAAIEKQRQQDRKDAIVAGRYDQSKGYGAFDALDDAGKQAAREAYSRASQVAMDQERNRRQQKLIDLNLLEDTPLARLKESLPKADAASQREADILNNGPQKRSDAFDEMIRGEIDKQAAAGIPVARTDTYTPPNLDNIGAAGPVGATGIMGGAMQLPPQDPFSQPGTTNITPFMTEEEQDQIVTDDFQKNAPNIQNITPFMEGVPLTIDQPFNFNQGAAPQSQPGFDPSFGLNNLNNPPVLQPQDFAQDIIDTLPPPVPQRGNEFDPSKLPTLKEVQDPGLPDFSSLPSTMPKPAAAPAPAPAPAPASAAANPRGGTRSNQQDLYNKIIEQGNKAGKTPELINMELRSLSNQMKGMIPAQADRFVEEKLRDFNKPEIYNPFANPKAYKEQQRFNKLSAEDKMREKGYGYEDIIRNRVNDSILEKTRGAGPSFFSSPKYGSAKNAENAYQDWRKGLTPDQSAMHDRRLFPGGKPSTASILETKRQDLIDDDMVNRVPTFSSPKESKAEAAITDFDKLPRYEQAKRLGINNITNPFL